MFTSFHLLFNLNKSKEVIFKALLNSFTKFNLKKISLIFSCWNKDKKVKLVLQLSNFQNQSEYTPKV